MSLFSDSYEQEQINQKERARPQNKVLQFLEWMDEDSKSDFLEVLQNPKIPHAEVVRTLMGMEGRPENLTIKEGSLATYRRFKYPEAFPPIPSRDQKDD